MRDEAEGGGALTHQGLMNLQAAMDNSIGLVVCELGSWGFLCGGTNELFGHSVMSFLNECLTAKVRGIYNGQYGDWFDEFLYCWPGNGD